MKYTPALLAVLATSVAAQQNQTNTILQNLQSLTAQGSAKQYNLSTLIGFAGKINGLTDKLGKNDTNYTVFAPTDAAFATLTKNFPDLVASLGNNTDALGDAINYHIVPNTVFLPSENTNVTKLFVRTADAKNNAIQVNLAKAVTLQFDAAAGQGNATVIDSIRSSNGVIHVVNAVLTQPRPAVDVAKAAGLSQLVAAASTNNDLVSALNNLKENTVFAPTDAAFKAVNEFATQNNINITGNLLTNILKFHVVKGVYFSTDIVKFQTASVATLLDNQNVTVTTSQEDGKPVVNVIGAGQATLKLSAAKVVKPDVLVSGGVVHVIDAVLIPDIAAANSSDPSVPKPADVAGNKNAASATTISRAAVVAAAVAAIFAVAL
ncbi:FAS1 domain-containing protein [Fimicolochytrium jonesii]|uniref:FAS1 domain-containing protein n=1 Tax=Fimicolochytrium jonesii TaxID=1396493 RepID=UPI0022FDB203|nr:FAS1 domain-containing protein [Fimicolochytrium jonesii]KAI8821274.1 FAS1 domain-containing protein [Fimicolochytrium jonesii]